MISISGAPPNSLAGGPPPPPYYDNYSGPHNPACFLTMDAANDWGGQSFTTTFKYSLKSVDLWLKKGPGANVGNVDVELYAVDGSGHPTGPPLNYGVIPNADIAESWTWVSCILGNGKLTYYLLDAATKYCPVVHGVGVLGNPLLWGCGGGGGGGGGGGDGSDYPNGDQEWSTDGGTIWTKDTTKDQLFRCFAPDFLDNYSGSVSPFIALTINSAAKWAGQSFTAMKSYTLNRIDIWMKKNIGDFVGDILFGLYSVDEDGHPDIVAGALSTGTLPDADVPTDYAWVPCDMSEYNVVVDTKYCIVVHGYSLDAGNLIIWSYDNYSGLSDYAGGDMEWSTDSGGAWSTTTTSDLLFRCYSSD